MERLSRGMERLSRGMERLSRGMERSSRGMERLSRGMERSSRGMEGLSRGMERLSRGMERLSRGMERLSRGMEGLSRGMERSSRGIMGLRRSPRAAFTILMNQAPYICYPTPKTQMKFRSLLLFLSLIIATKSLSQPMLPDIIGITQKGLNILSWTSQYEKLKSIAVQRSSDSFFNYATIGYVKDLKKGPQAFIDGHPLPGNNWYRLQIAFGSDLTWTS